MNQNLIGPRFCSSNQSHFWTTWDLLQSLHSAPGLQAPGTTLPPALHEWVCPSCVHPLIGLCLGKHPCEDSIPWPFAQTPVCSADFRALAVWPEHTLWRDPGLRVLRVSVLQRARWGKWTLTTHRWKKTTPGMSSLEIHCFESFFGGALQHSIWDLSCLTRDWTYAHCSGRMESQPLDRQGSLYFFNLKRAFLLNEWQYFQKF